MDSVLRDSVSETYTDNKKGFEKGFHQYKGFSVAGKPFSHLQGFPENGFRFLLKPLTRSVYLRESAKIIRDDTGTRAYKQLSQFAA